ncbi:unnamed protein product [Taphrina deformans PYCC 5710]|uniref:Uncharacterized protein n=1 Tax=Taphrina deformans (strain PYCC 5710 / ATCC 11124 / CBS 356.35 / IMI 108563 / JCM 9778 / NBRC 8474) TaxID=1097556 RepID=R4XKC1_TAPDE|nr:unnamed protein product [Taphrina deformans PYCC 5710]|eukprot:CCG84908.1 unnamed protein product [Taphrina deformans PYCC 5710]
MTVAANLLVGSSCGNVYILRCVVRNGSITLKTTIQAGETPIQLLVDVDNKCFYCLDNAASSPEGRLLTLAPTELGTIEQSMSISTGGIRPHAMINIGKTIFINHQECYSIVKSPIAPKSTRRRRTSTLAPVTEDPVAEGLDTLYHISKTMHDDSDTADPSDVIALIQQHIHSESHIDVTELKSVVPTDEPILKFVHWLKEDYIVGLTSRGLTSYRVSDAGLLHPLKSKEVPDVIDCEAGNDSLFVLCRGSLKQGTLSDGEFLLEREYAIDAPRATSLKVLGNRERAFIMTPHSVISINLESSSQKVLDIRGTSMALSTDDDLLWVANKEAGTIAMYTVLGKELGQCRVERPASIVHMS